MTHSPTPEERAALKVAHAATDTPDASYDLVSTIVFALGSAQLLQSPEKAAELTRRRAEDLALRGELAPADGSRAVPFDLGPSLVPAMQWLTARVAELEGAAELLPFVSALEIPRPGNRLPLLLQRVYGTADRWFISDREGRRWHRLYGWVCEPGGLTAEEHTRDAARFTLAEAVPTARLIVQDEAPEALHAASGAVIEIPARQRVAVEDPHDSKLHHNYRVGRDLPPAVTP